MAGIDNISNSSSGVCDATSGQFSALDTIMDGDAQSIDHQINVPNQRTSAIIVDRICDEYSLDGPVFDPDYEEMIKTGYASLNIGDMPTAIKYFCSARDIANISRKSA